MISFANAYAKIFGAKQFMLSHSDQTYPGQPLRIAPQA